MTRRRWRRRRRRMWRRRVVPRNNLGVRDCDSVML